MNLRIPLLVTVLVASSALAPARAQLVHLSFEAEAENGSYRLSGDRQLFYPWDTGGRGRLPGPLRLDIYYDLSSPRASADESGVGYGPLDPTRNFLRVRLDDPRVGKPFDIIRPLEGIFVQESALFTSSLVQDSSGYAEFEFSMGFVAPISDAFALPAPPFPNFDPAAGPRLFLQGDATLFDLEGLAEGSLSAAFDAVRAEIVQDFTPVPEPSAYGLAAILAIGFGVLWWRRKIVRTSVEQNVAV